MHKAVNIPSILSLEVTPGEHKLSQDAYVDVATQLCHLAEKEHAFLKRVASKSGIKTRYSVLSDFSRNGDRLLFGKDFPHTLPGSGARGELYRTYAPLLAEQVATKALVSWGEAREEISHIIFVSCTGMMAPGVEFLLIKRLGLSPSTQRVGLNFMGCFGVFRGLAVAHALAAESVQNRVLLVSVELCSLHMQAATDAGTLISNMLFGDGAGACVVGIPNEYDHPLFVLNAFTSRALPNSTDAMTWRMSDHGFVMTLMPDVPRQITATITDITGELLAQRDPASCLWAIHPGGRAIIEGIEKACDLRRYQTQSSWNVLERFGNMSSATFLFVLHDMYDHAGEEDTSVIGLGFGPGLSAEGVRVALCGKKNVHAI